ncbi:unnamed protein product, partial [Prorocentrum cordatum]
VLCASSWLRGAASELPSPRGCASLAPCLQGSTDFATRSSPSRPPARKTGSRRQRHARMRPRPRLQKGPRMRRRKARREPAQEGRTMPSARPSSPARRRPRGGRQTPGGCRPSAARQSRRAPLGNWKQALALYTECVELDANDHLHWSNRALVQDKLGRHDEMLEDALRCVELKPDFVKGWTRVGAANLALERFDAAEEAFRRALALDPESAASREGLAAVERAREEAVLQEEDEFDVVLREVKMLGHAELRRRALEEGVREEKIEDAERREDVKEALISLIFAHRYIVDLVQQDLVGLDCERLCSRAREEGLDEEQITAVVRENGNPGDLLRALIVDYVSNDLVGSAIEILDAAEFEEVPDEDTDAAVEDLDIEVVDVGDDIANLELGAGDVFLAGAYIDSAFGELVLPNGLRLGHRSMHRYYKQRLRPDDGQQVVLRSSRLDLVRWQAKIARQQGWKSENRISGAASKAGASSTVVRKQRTELHNMKMWHNLHMWGMGGGGSHYWGAGGKQYNKGNKVKGLILRHSRQGAKLQAARNKANRGDASCAVLR